MGTRGLCEQAENRGGQRNRAKSRHNRANSGAEAALSSGAGSSSLAKKLAPHGPLITNAALSLVRESGT